MRLPDKHNYEEWLLDLAEGRLTSSEASLLKAFAQAHPELEISFDVESLPVIEPDAGGFGFKSDLRKSETDDKLLNYFEGQMAPEERGLFSQLVASDPLLKAELEVLGKTRLTQDLSQVFESKAALKKTTGEWFEADPALARFEQSAVNAAFDSEIAGAPEWQVLQHTRAVADKTIVFPDKDSLRKQGRVVPLFSRSQLWRAAAAVLFVAGLSIVAGYYFGGDRGVRQVSESNPRRHVPPVAESPLSGTPDPAVAAINNRAETSSGETPVKIRSIQPWRKSRSKQIAHAPEVKLELPATETASEAAVTVTVKPAVAKPDTLSEQVAFVQPVQESSETLTTLQFVPYLEDEYETEEPVKERTTLLQRLASLAGHANKLGITAVDGSATREGYRISLFSRSVEKK
jgi:hypothetical protein